MPLWFLVVAPLLAALTAFVLGRGDLPGEWLAAVSFGVPGIATAGAMMRIGLNNRQSIIAGLGTSVAMASLYFLILWLSLRGGLYDGPGW